MKKSSRWRFIGILSFINGGVATILANRLPGGNLVAGDVFLEKGQEAIAGIVTYIDYTDGYFRINGDPGLDSGGTIIRLNDPEGRHTVQAGLGCAGGPNCSADPRFTNDPDNYTFVFATGYPACLPSTVSRTFTDIIDLDNDGDTAETLTTAANGNGSGSFPPGTGDLLCPETNRTIDNGNPVDDSRLFAPLQTGDWVDAEGNMESIGGANFLSAHTIIIGAALTTKDEPNQPDYMIFDEVEWDVAGFQNERARTLLIGFTTLPNPDVEVYNLNIDPATGAEHEAIVASALGCESPNVAGPGSCTGQGIPPNQFGIFKIRYDVDFFEAAANPPGEPVKPKNSPCLHLNNANLGALGLTSPCSGTITLGQEFSVVSPISRDLIGRTRHTALGDPALLVTLDITGQSVQNGQYLNPVGVGHPEFVEINLAAIQTPFIFAGEPWNLDRRLGPGGCEPGNTGACDAATPQPLCPFPYSELDPRRQADNIDPLTGQPIGVPADAEDRIFAHYPFGPGDILNWPPPANAVMFDSYIADPTTLDWNAACPGGGLPNAAPAAVDDAADAPLDTAVTIGVAANDTDSDGTIDVATVAIVTAPANGTAVPNGDGTVTYTPNTGFTGVDTFTYTIDDDGGATSNAANVDVSVGLGNVAPTAVDDTAAVIGGAPVIIDVLANDSDPDSALDPASVLVTAAPANGVTSVDPATGQITYTPNNSGSSPIAEGPINPDNGFPAWYQDNSGSGPDSFQYIVADDEGAVSNTATVSITADGLVLQLCIDVGATGPCLFDGDPALGEPPVDPSIPPFVADDEADSNFAPEAFWWLAQAIMPTNGGGQAILILAQEATFLDPAGIQDRVQNGHQAYFGRTRIRVDNLVAGATYTVTHPFGVETFVATTSGTRGINVTRDMGVDPGTSVFDSFAGPYLTWDNSGAPPPAGFIGDPNVDHTLIGSPSGNNIFRIEGPDVGGSGVDMIETDLFAVLGKIAGVTAVSDQATTVTDTAVAIPVLGNDIDSPGVAIDAAGVSLTAAPANGTASADALTGEITYTPDTGFTGTDQFRYTVLGSNGSVSNETIVTVAINAANSPPVANDDTAGAATDGGPVTINLTGNDSDADANLDPASVVIVSGPANGVLVNNGDGTVDYTPNAGFSGTDSFTYTVADAAGAVSNQATVTITVAGNTPPVAINDNATTREGTSVTIDVLANDSDADVGDVLTVTAVDGISANGGVIVNNNDGTVTYTAPPAGTFTGLDTFNYTISDGIDTASAIVTVDVTPDTPDVLTVGLAMFRTGRGEWRIRGRADVFGPGNFVTIHNGPSLSDPVLAVIEVDNLGRWEFRGPGPAPHSSETVALESTAGGVLTNVSVFVRQ